MNQSNHLMRQQLHYLYIESFIYTDEDVEWAFTT